MKLVELFLVLICPLAALAFAVRIVCASFSARIAGQIRRHPAVHIVWGLLAIIGFLVYAGPLNPRYWPPSWVERRAQRATVNQRIQSAGGWAALQRDCDEIVAQHRNDEFYWMARSATNALPPAIAVLEPMQVRFESPELISGQKYEPKPLVVHIGIFGMPRSGWRSTPYFGLEVVSGTNAANYRPDTAGGGVSGNHHDQYRKVTETIYEVF